MTATILSLTFIAWGENMAKIKEQSEKIKSGISSDYGTPRGAIKNLVLGKNGVFKRNGHTPLIRLTDEALSPLRINGIFDFAYHKNGQDIFCRVVHAKNKLFKLNEDFSSPVEIPLEGGIAIKDQKSKGFAFGQSLFIIGAGDILIYDGETIKRAYKSEGSYIPTTTVGITDQLNSMKRQERESGNIFNPRRKNTFLGSTIKREKDLPSIFLLDEKIKYGTKIILEVKIRTITSGEEPSETSTSYIGIDKTGNEVSRVITLRFERDNISANDTMLLLEPPKDEFGEEIKIKIGDKIHSYETMPFGISIKNQNELMLTFECNAPIVGKDNITLEYEADVDYSSQIKLAELGALANGENGAQVMLVCFGDNRVYFTDEQKGFLYLPEKNQISLGARGEKITAITQLWDNLFGAFKKNSFYRIVISEKPQLHSSLDSIGAYNSFVCCLCDYDCLVLNERGIFGIDDYKSQSTTQSSLTIRASDIESLLDNYSEDEKQNAHGVYLNGYFYLFIGNDAFVALTKEKKGKSSSYEYSWCLWNDIGARYAYHSGGKLYFGNENGEIRTFDKFYYDLKEVNYKVGEGMLIDNSKDFSHLTLDKSEIDTLEYARVRVGKHKRVLAENVGYKNGSFILADSFNLIDNSPAVFQGDKCQIYSQNNLVAEGVVIEASPVEKTIKIDTGATFSENVIYAICLVIDSLDYDILAENSGGYSLTYGGKKQKLLIDDNELKIRWQIPIESQYETDTIFIEKGNIIKKLSLELNPESQGKIDLEIKTRKTSYKGQVISPDTIDFESLSFNNMSFERVFKKRATLPLFIRGTDYIKIKISTKSDKPFSLDALSLCLKGEK